MPGAANLSVFARAFAQEIDAELLKEFDRTDARFDSPQSQAMLDRALGSTNHDLFPDEGASQAMDVDGDEGQEGR